MSEAKIPWLAEAANRLRLYHIEIDAAMRRLAWGEEFTQEDETAFVEVICAADKIRASAIQHLRDQRQKRVHHRLQQNAENIKRLVSHNGTGQNGARPVIGSY
jgi:hypothetical protein